MLPNNHTDKDSSGWQKKTMSNPPASLQIGVLSIRVPLAFSDTGALASALKPEDPTIATGIWSNSSFGGAFDN